MVRRYAATVYQQGGNFGELEAFLSASGPQDLMDRATGCQAVGDPRAQALQKAAATAIVAGLMQRQAAQAQAQQLRRLPRRPRAPATPPRPRPTRPRPPPTEIQAQQSELVVQLATLRKTSVALEGQRQDGLAAARRPRGRGRRGARQARLPRGGGPPGMQPRSEAAQQAAARR